MVDSRLGSEIIVCRTAPFGIRPEVRVGSHTHPQEMISVEVSDSGDAYINSRQLAVLLCHKSESSTYKAMNTLAKRFHAVVRGDSIARKSVLLSKVPCMTFRKNGGREIIIPWFKARYREFIDSKRIVKTGFSSENTTPVKPSDNLIDTVDVESVDIFPLLANIVPHELSVWDARNVLIKSGWSDKVVREMLGISGVCSHCGGTGNSPL